MHGIKVAVDRLSVEVMRVGVVKGFDIVLDNDFAIATAPSAAGRQTVVAMVSS